MEHAAAEAGSTLLTFKRSFDILTPADPEFTGEKVPLSTFPKEKFNV